MYYTVAYDPQKESLATSRIWHRERKFDRDVLPEPGKRYFRYVFSLPSTTIDHAIALISVDHSHTLFVNQKMVSSGADWRKVSPIDLKDVLKEGENIIAIEGANEGNVANPAGILFALKILYADGKETLIQSSTDWLSTDKQPEGEWTKLEYDVTEWKKVRNYGSAHWDKLVSFSFDAGEGEIARAALVRQHPFMKALGRPSRENVATSRSEEATLLQALELTNGAYFNSVLHEGADLWMEKYGADSEKIGEVLYQKSLGRNPTKKEMRVILDVLGENPDAEALQDLFWATILMPEFQFIL
jgi:hypothetical protein